MFLVTVNIEVLRMARREIGDRLVGQVYFNFCIGIILNGRKQFRQKAFAYLYGQHKIIELVVLVDICKE